MNRLASGRERIAAAASHLVKDLGSARTMTTILVFGAAYQILFRVLTFSVDHDHASLLSSAINFWNGGDLGAMSIRVQDLSIIHRSRLAHWPPGFSLLALFFLFILRSVYAAVLAVDVAGMALFFFACWFLLTRLRPALPEGATGLFALAAAFTGSLHIDYFTNPWTLGLFLLSVALLLPREDGGEPSPRTCFLAGALLGLTPILRYAYGPASLMPVVAMAACHWRTAEGRRRVYSLAAGWMCGVAPFLWWKFVYVRSVPVGALRINWDLHPANLARFHPFAGDALFGRRLSENFPLSMHKFKTSIDAVQFALRHVLSAVVLVCAALGARHAVKHGASDQGRRIAGRFFAMGAVTIAANVLFLVALSLLHAPYLPLWGWVYVEEPRYYAVCLPFILAGIACAAARGRAEGASIALRKYTSLLIFGLAALVWIADVPGEVSAMADGKIGGPVDRYFADEGRFLSSVRRQAALHPPLVCVEFGKIGSLGILRRHQSTIAGVPMGFAPWRAKLRTSGPVNVLFFAANSQKKAIHVAVNSLCRELGGEPVQMRGFTACRAALRPSD